MEKGGSVILLFVRAKEISGRRYLYLVYGVRSGPRVTQITLAYLGELSKLTLGIREETKIKVQSKLKRCGRKNERIDWNQINDQIRKIPISIEELKAIRRRQFANSIKTRSKLENIKEDGSKTSKLKISVREVLSQRAKGELDALVKLSTISFKDRFQEIGERTYRMRDC